MESNTFVYLEFLRRYLLTLPAVTQKMAYGTPAFYVGKNIFTRIKDDGQTLVIACGRRDEWMQLYPHVYFITDHYLNYNYVLANLENADPEQLKELLLDAWRLRAPKTLRKQHSGL
jgi:hypothetical protein